MNKTKKENKTALVTNKAMTKLMNRMSQLERRESQETISREHRAKLEKFARNFSTAHEPMKLPTTMPAYTTATADGGTLDITNDDRTTINYAIFDPMNPDRAFISFERINIANTTTQLTCPNFSFQRLGDYTTTLYYLGIPIEFSDSTHGLVRRCASHETASANVAVIGSSGNHKGFSATYRGLDISAGTLRWSYIGNVDPNSTIALTTGDTGNEVTVATASLRSGTMAVPAVNGSNWHLVIRMAPNKCDALFNFNMEGMILSHTNNNVFVQKIRSIYDFSGSSSTESYADSAKSSRLVAASMYMQAAHTAFSTGQLKVGISQDRLEMDMNPSEAFDRMNTKKYYTMPTSNLNDGAFATFLPNEKLDYRFSKTPIKTNIIVMTWKNVIGGDDGGASTQLTFELRTVREYITTQQLIVPTLSHSGGMKLAVAYISFLIRNEMYLLDNHTHLKKIGKAAKDFVNSPEFHRVLKTLGKSTVTALLAAL